MDSSSHSATASGRGARAAGFLLAIVLVGCRARPPAPEIRAYARLRPTAAIRVGATADWVLATGEGVWVASTKPDGVVRVDPGMSAIRARVALPGEACSGLAEGFGSIWAPLCGGHGTKAGLARIDERSHSVAAIFPVGPPQGEGGVATSADSVWLALDGRGTLARIDPATGVVRQRVTVAAGSFNPIVSEGVVWVTSHAQNLVTAVDASSGAILGTVATGPQPRFLTAGGGSIWVLNQGDGSLTRIDAAARRATATIATGATGSGGDLAYGDGAVWVTVFHQPLARVDADNGRVTRVWTGRGGDSLRVGFGAIWITDYRQGKLLRLSLAGLR